MTRAYAHINVFTMDGALRYEVIYHASYRHSPRRLGSFPSEQTAIRAVALQASNDGADQLTVQAGRYPKGTRRTGDIIAGDSEIRS